MAKEKNDFQLKKVGLRSFKVQDYDAENEFEFAKFVKSKADATEGSLYWICTLQLSASVAGLVFWYVVFSHAGTSAKRPGMAGRCCGNKAIAFSVCTQVANALFVAVVFVARCFGGGRSRNAWHGCLPHRMIFFDPIPSHLIALNYI